MGGKLTAKRVKNENRVGWHSDGSGYGLVLRVRSKVEGGLTKTWIQRLTIGGRATTLGLGSIDVVSLAEARDMARENWLITKKGGNPRRSSEEPTFRAAAEAVIEARRPGWKNGGKSEAQWRHTLEAFAYPAFGDKLVSEVTVHDVREAIRPIWHEKPETAERTRSRISIVLNYAVSEGHRIDDPARKKVMESLGRTKRPRQHQRSIPHQHLRAALATVDGSNAEPLTKLAVEFVVLTACRSGECRGARWAEIDFATATWTIPASRTKTKQPHRVALSRRAVDILTTAQQLCGGNELVFPAPRGGQMSDNTLSAVLKRLNLDGTIHGMRASFRTWAADTGHSAEQAEFAIGHRPKGDKAAYARSDLLEQRRPLMQDWAHYVAQTSQETSSSV